MVGILSELVKLADAARIDLPGMALNYLSRASSNPSPHITPGPFFSSNSNSNSPSSSSIYRTRSASTPPNCSSKVEPEKGIQGGLCDLEQKQQTVTKEVYSMSEETIDKVCQEEAKTQQKAFIREADTTGGGDSALQGQSPSGAGLMKQTGIWSFYTHPCFSSCLRPLICPFVLAPKGPGPSKKPPLVRTSSFGQSRDKCSICDKAVYFNERVRLGDAKAFAASRPSSSWWLTTVLRSL